MLPAQVQDSILPQLQSYEDYLSAYIQLDEAQTGVSWFKADIIAQMFDKMGDSSLKALAQDLKQPFSTVVNYLRTARAFPNEKRDPGASFSHHFQASMIDKFDSKTGQFQGDERFKMLEDAIDNNWSTRKLAEAIQEKKTPELAIQNLQTDEAQFIAKEVQKETRKLVKEVSEGSEKALTRLRDIWKFIDGK